METTKCEDCSKVKELEERIRKLEKQRDYLVKKLIRLEHKTGVIS